MSNHRPSDKGRASQGSRAKGKGGSRGFAQRGQDWVTGIQHQVREGDKDAIWVELRVMVRAR